jgi:ATP-dependent helicase HrpB
MLLEAVEEGLGYEASLLALMLSEGFFPAGGIDLRQEMETLHHRLRRPETSRIRRILERLMDRLGLRGPFRPPRSEKAGYLTALAYPERIALRRNSHGSGYLSAAGRGLSLRGGSPSEWELLAVAVLGGEGRESTIHKAAPLSRELLRERPGHLLREEERVAFNPYSGIVEARRILRLESLILEERPLPRPRRELLAKGVREAVRHLGREKSLPCTPRSRAVLLRLALLRRYGHDEFPDPGEEALSAEIRSWLDPWLDGVGSLEELRKLEMEKVWRHWLGWERWRRLEELAPERILLPSGRREAVDYSDPAAPVLAAKLQECFGWRETPRILGGRVALTLHLLSPAGRPLAVTRDLEYFWRSVYPEVRKEMRGRYPKHPWPEDPSTAEATARTLRQLRERKTL